MGHETPIQFFLRDLGYERNLFCRLTAVETNHWKLATGRRLGSSTMAVVASSGDAPAVAVAQAGAPPPSVESARVVLATQIDGTSSAAMAARV
jgi:hypothetical protein